MKILFLDDDHERHAVARQHFAGHDVTYVFDADQAMTALAATRFDAVFLDHDLPPLTQRVEKTGWVVARYIESMATKPPIVVIHSNYEPGAALMAQAVRDCDLVVCHPFGADLFALLAREGVLP